MPDPLVIPVGFAQCIVGGTNTNLNRRASFSFGAQLGFDEASLGGHLATFLSSTAAGHLAQKMLTNWRIDQVEVLGNSLGSVNSVNTVGINASTELPPNCSVKVHKITGVRGKANRGYMFPFGLNEADTIDDNGNLQAAFRTALDTIWGNLFAAIGTDGSEPVILHHTSSSVVVPTPITSFVTLGQVATQRRRLSPRP